MVELTVAEAYKMDVGRNICRIDSETMEKLSLNTGEIVAIKGKTVTPASVWRLRPDDEGKGIIRMDGNLRFNAGVSLGDKVSVEKAEVKNARSITINPTEPVRFGGDVSEYFKERLLDKAFVKGNKLSFEIFGNTFNFVISNTVPKGIVKVNEDTEVIISETVQRPEQLRIPEVTYEDIGGLDDAIMKIREMVELPLKHPQIFQRLGIKPPKGVLLHGPPGTGKTLLAKAVANEANANFYVINGPELMSMYYGKSEENLRNVFEEAEKNAPSIIFIDEIDALAPKREEVSGEVEKRMVSQLLTLMDGLRGRGDVIVIGATNLPNVLDPALRRPGRFDREIRIGIPDRKGRKEILQIHTRGMPLSEDVDLDKLADMTHGFTGADIEMLCKEAAMKCLRRVLPDIEKLEEGISSEILEKLVVEWQDFMKALNEIEPTGMREVAVETPNVRWKDIGGLEEVKKELRESIELPIKNPEVFRRIGIVPPRGILLYGPPGTGKTLLAKAIATESGLNFIAIKGPEIMSKWVGESEKAIRDIFRRARDVAPSVIFFDEIDAIAPRRGYGGSHEVTERVVSQLLTEIDGIEKLRDVVIIGATNRIDRVDNALLRPGRFEKQIYIPLPDEKAREEIFKIHTRNMPLSKDVKIKELVKRTEGYSGADIEAVCREAGMNAIRENNNAKEVKMKHFEMALERIKASVKEGESKELKNGIAQ